MRSWIEMNFESPDSIERINSLGTWSNERIDRSLNPLEGMKGMKLGFHWVTISYERLLFYPWILTQALVDKMGIL